MMKGEYHHRLDADIAPTLPEAEMSAILVEEEGEEMLYDDIGWYNI